MSRQEYSRKAGTTVVAVQLDLKTDGFTYHKWSGVQTCKAGDWVVDNGGDVYTVDQDTFARTYRSVGDGRYEKTSKVWAEIAAEPGRIRTKEGVTHYDAGDYLVFNDRAGKDGYAMTAETFERLYERVRSG